ncbi:MAG: glycosyltransferase, partial [Rhodospirillales bacterium]|nr:glycosyltransferase [Rhodospirillales bacterium]
MRLLQAMAGAPHGGAELFFERLATALNKRPEIEQRVLIRRDPRRKTRLLKDGVEARELSFGGIFDLATPARFRTEIRDFAPQAVLTWMNRATGRCPRAKGRFVHIGRLGGYYNLKYYRHCDHLIGNTQGIVDYLVREGWPAERAHYLPNFVPDARKEAVPRSVLDTPDDAPLLLGMGRLHENKAFDVLLQAL